MITGEKNSLSNRTIQLNDNFNLDDFNDLEKAGHSTSIIVKTGNIKNTWVKVLCEEK